MSDTGSASAAAAPEAPTGAAAEATAEASPS
jgi:hypothetical protein